MRLADEADLTSWQLKEAFDAEVAARPELLAADTAARRHGIAVLLKIYTHCIDGQQRIAEAFGTQYAEKDPGDEATAT